MNPDSNGRVAGELRATDGESRGEALRRWFAAYGVV
jgi:hypothetical protein